MELRVNMSTDEQAYQGQLLALMRRLTQADGLTTDEEVSWLKALEQEFGSESAPDATFSADTLRSLVEGEGQAEELVELLLMVSLADGQTTPDEWRLIQEVGAIVGLSSEEVERLRSQTILAVDP